MGQLSAVLGVIGAVLGLAGILGAAVAVIRVNLARTTIAVYRDDNDALRGRVETLEAEKLRDHATIASLESRLAALDEERALLRDLATGKTAIDTLAAVIERHHAEVLSMLNKLTIDRRDG